MRSSKHFLILAAALLLLPALASAETITFTSTNSNDSAWYWAGPGQPLWGSILSGTATVGSTGQTTDISCGADCWVSWGTGNGSATTTTTVAFDDTGSFIWIYGNDGSGNPTLFLDGTFSGMTLTDNGDGTYTLTSNFTGTLSTELLALLGLASNGSITVGGAFTSILSGSLDPNSGGFGWHDPNDPSTWGQGILQVTVADDFPGRSPVPEPGSMALFGTGMLGLAGLVRRKLST